MKCVWLTVLEIVFGIYCSRSQSKDKKKEREENQEMVIWFIYGHADEIPGGCIAPFQLSINVPWRVFEHGSQQGTVALW